MIFKFYSSVPIRVTVRIAGLIAAAWGFASLDAKALATFGVLLCLDLWMTQGKLTQAAKEIQLYEYLSGPDLIWGRALDLLKNARPDDEIRSTATFPNHPKFEKEIIRKVSQKELIYSRLLCYAEPAKGGDCQHNDFPPVDEIVGKTRESLLETYLCWYQKFYVAWERAQEREDSEIADCVAMQKWHSALEKLRTNHFHVRKYTAGLPTDYFILRPHVGEQWSAVIGFPRLEREGMRTGFSITHSLLAKDLGDNWKRLWESQESRAKQDPAAT